LRRNLEKTARLRADTSNKTASGNPIVNLTLTRQSRRLWQPRHGRCTTPPAQPFKGMRVRETGTDVSRHRGKRGRASRMKHPVSRDFFTYWQSKRGEARAPERTDIDPSDLRELLGDIFVLAYDDAATHPFRVAGTRVCALFGRDVKDQSFPTLFARQHRRDISDIIAAVAEDVLPAVAGLTATSA